MTMIVNYFDLAGTLSSYITFKPMTKLPHTQGCRFCIKELGSFLLPMTVTHAIKFILKCR